MRLLLVPLLATLIVPALAEPPKPPDAARVHIRNVAAQTVLRPRNAREETQLWELLPGPANFSM